MKEETYSIGGMHCAACSSAVERVTRKLEGVERSDVNLPMNRMTIVYDENRVNPEAIISKIEKAGFTAEKVRATCCVLTATQQVTASLQPCRY